VKEQIDEHVWTAFISHLAESKIFIFAFSAPRAQRAVKF
jgi:hypothetical protein